MTLGFPAISPNVCLSIDQLSYMLFISTIFFLLPSFFHFFTVFSFVYRYKIFGLLLKQSGATVLKSICPGCQVTPYLFHLNRFCRLWEGVTNETQKQTNLFKISVFYFTVIKQVNHYYNYFLNGFSSKNLGASQPPYEQKETVRSSLIKHAVFFLHLLLDYVDKCFIESHKVKHVTFYIFCQL